MGKDRVKNGPGLGRAAKKCGQPATRCPQEILGFSQNFLINYSSQSYPRFWNFGKKILKKGNPNLRITMLFRSCKPVDVIILTQENRGHPLPQNPRVLAQGII
jgi:hypothetical protein